MAKKQKERSETEYLRSVIRNLKSENRNLKKQLSRANKRIDFSIPDMEDEFELISEPIKKNKCPKCNEELITSDIGLRILIKCKSCSYRESKKR